MAIAWPQSLSSKVTRLSEGNARVMGILIAINPKICVIGTYMQTNNPSVNSSIEYADFLDIIQHMAMTYEETHEIIIIGDLNSTLNTHRNYNRHDLLLQSFVRALGLHVEHSEKQTFYHHSGASTSQIDYILSLNDKTLKDYRVHDQSAENLSNHVSVSATLNTNIVSRKKHGKIPQRVLKKSNWKKADIEGFQRTLKDNLYKLEQTESGTVNDNLTSLMVLLLKSTKQNVPRRIVQLRGPRWKASPTVRDLLENTKVTYRTGKQLGRQNDQLKKEKKLCAKPVKKTTVKRTL